MLLLAMLQKGQQTDSAHALSRAFVWLLKNRRARVKEQNKATRCNDTGEGEDEEKKRNLFQSTVNLTREKKFQCREEREEKRRHAGLDRRVDC